MYTTGSAYINREEKDKGSLEPGKLADFIVLDRDYMTCPVEEVSKIQVLKNDRRREDGVRRGRMKDDEG